MKYKDIHALKYKIGVSGSAVDNCAPGAFEKAYELGREVAKHGAVCVTGDTTGIPFEAARGAKDGGGFNIGFSPAVSRLEHIKKYHLPEKYMDLVIYTGFEYSGRNLFFIRSCDALIFVCGRIGTLNEFTIAFEDHKPIGILTQTGGIAGEIDHILDVAQRDHRKIIADDDPHRLASRIINIVKKEYSRKK